jgi:hypothetical protein
MLLALMLLDRMHVLPDYLVFVMWCIPVIDLLLMCTAVRCNVTYQVLVLDSLVERECQKPEYVTAGG